MLRTLADADSISAALGIWVNRHLPLHEEWLGSLPVGTVDLITDQAAVDSWADEQTAGLIKEFPAQVSDETILALATALIAKTNWQDPFCDEGVLTSDGPWSGHNGTHPTGLAVAAG